MKRVLKNGIFIFLIFDQFVFCNMNEDASSEISTAKDVEIDTNAVLTSIEPKSISRDSSMKMIVKLLKLNEPGGFAIRIWLNNSSDTGKLIELIVEKEKSISSFHKYKTETDSLGNIISIESQAQEGTPISGWKEFSQKINEAGLNQLRNYKDIPDYYTCTDGNHLAIEVWRENQYRIYDYPCFELYEAKLNEVRNICSLIAKEFGFKLLDISM